MSGLKVLIFEYDRPFADALERAFARRGCSVRVVDDGQVGLEVALDDRPGLIILAIELPRMNGFAVCNRIKKNPDLKDIPLIIVSSDSPPETFEQHSKLRTKAEDYLHKPIDPEALIARAAQFVEIPSARESEIFVDEETVEEAADDAPINLDNDLSGLLTDAGFDSIVLESNPPPGSAPAAPSIPASAASLLEAPPDAPPLLGRPAASADDFEDFTMVSGNLELPPDIQQIARAVEATTPPPLRRTVTTPAPALTGMPSLPRVGVPSPVAPPPSVPSGPSAADLERAQRRAEELERELAAARVAGQRAAELAEENARLRAQGEELTRLRAQSEELARVTRELEEARRTSSVPSQAAAAPARPGGVSTREVLELREGLNRKDKEIHARDREILELRDKLLQAEMSAADVDDRLAEREHEAATARQSHESIQVELQAEAARRADAERALAASRETAGQGEAALRQQVVELEARLAHEGQSMRHQLETAAAAAAAAVAAREATEASLREEHARALEQARSEALAHARQGEAALRAELEQARAEHAGAVASLRSEHAAMADGLRSDYVAAAESTKAEHAAALASLATESTARREMGERISALESELSAARSQGTVLAAELSASHEKGDASVRELASVRERLAAMERRQASAEALLDKARQAMEIAAGLVHAATHDEAKAEPGATTEA